MTPCQPDAYSNWKFVVGHSTPFYLYPILCCSSSISQLQEEKKGFGAVNHWKCSSKSLRKTKIYHASITCT